MVAPNSKFNFTKKKLEELSTPPIGKRYSFKDEKERGLIIRITANGQKTFQLYQKFQGRPVRVTLGTFPDTTVEKARRKAKIAKGELAVNKNPNVEKNKLRQEITLKELFHLYMKKYSKVQKKSWKYDEREINKFLSHWFNRKISDISKHEISDLHLKLMKANGLYQGNRVLERLRAMYNKAISWGWDGANPTLGIKKFKEKSRDRYIMPSEMPLLFQALNLEENKTAKDYIFLSLLTGARKSNMLAMRWEEIDWDRRAWRIPDTKNGEPVTVPLIEQAIEILEARRIKTNSEWVFEAKTSTGHLSDPKKTWDRIRKRATLELWKQTPEHAKIIEDIDKNLKETNNYGYTVVKLFNCVEREAKKRKIKLPLGLMDLRIHDIRRTLGSYQAITGASLPIIGKTLGHKNLQSTQVYARLHDDPVREAMNKATEAMFGFSKNVAK